MKKPKGKGMRRARGPRGPRKPKSYWEVSQLKGGEYFLDETTGMTMELYDRMEDQKITFEDLLIKFYRIHLKQDNHEERLQPIAFKLLDNPHAQFAEKSYTGVMYGGFHVNIFPNVKKTAGPHAAQLWFRSHTPPYETYWIASLQVMAFFFNRKEILEALMVAIENKEWYMSEKDKQSAIVP